MCVYTNVFNLNGSPHGFFPGKRGLRQGDPMSPSLFILCMEYLSRLISIKVHFNFHAKCEKTKITHLAFADDLMLFCRGDHTSLKILSEAMDEFQACSGLETNKHKSNLFVAGVQGHELDQLQQVFSFPLGTLPIKYLGVPLNSVKLNVMHYSPIIEKLASSSNKWAGKNLSHAGKVELIKSVLQGTECYWLQVFNFPSNVIDRITAIARNFLWGEEKSPVAWKDCCLPLVEGGLGLRDLKSWNWALLSKILWNINEKADSLWIKWIHTEFIKQGSLWTWKLKEKDSPFLKRLLETETSCSPISIKKKSQTSGTSGLEIKAHRKRMNGLDQKG